MEIPAAKAQGIHGECNHHFAPQSPPSPSASGSNRRERKPTHNHTRTIAERNASAALAQPRLHLACWSFCPKNPRAPNNTSRNKYAAPSATTLYHPAAIPPPHDLEVRQMARRTTTNASSTTTLRQANRLRARHASIVGTRRASTVLNLRRVETKRNGIQPIASRPTTPMA